MRNRTCRRIAAVLALCALAFSQLALSAHTCHRTHDGGSSAPAMAPGEPCENMQGPMDGDANVCEQHCQYGKASLDKQQPPVAAFDSAAQPLRIAVLDLSSAQPSAASVRRPVPAATPPPALLFGVLRI